MLKRLIAIISIVSPFCSVYASEAKPKSIWSWFWRGRNEALEKEKIFESMNKEWQQVKTVLEQYIEQLSEALGDIGLDEVEDGLEKLEVEKKEAQDRFDLVVGGYLSRYIPNKLLSDNDFLDENDAIIQQAKTYHAELQFLLQNFETYLLNSLKKIKRVDQPKSPEQSFKVSLQDRITQDWNKKVLDTIRQSAKDMARQLGVSLPSTKNKNELLAILDSNAKIVMDELTNMCNNIDDFEQTWSSKVKDELKLSEDHEAVQFLDGLMNLKQTYIDQFRSNIVDHWKDPRMHNNPDEFKN